MPTTIAKFTPKEMEDARQMAAYEDRWVAVAKVGSRETVAASGGSIIDAKKEADALGIKNPIFRKVPSARKILIANAFFRAACGI